MSHGPLSNAATQLVMILFNALITELLVTFFWSNVNDREIQCDPELKALLNSTDFANETNLSGNGLSMAGRRLAGRKGSRSNSNPSEVSDEEICSEGGVRVMTLLITGCFEAFCLLSCAVVCRIIFRVSNRYHPNKRFVYRVREYAILPQSSSS